MENKFTLSEASREIDVPGMGRNKIYMVLRELGIIDEFNSPAQKYIDNGFLDYGSPIIYKYGYRYQAYVTLVVGEHGLKFLKQVVEDYLKTHPVPKIPKYRF